MLKSTKPLVSVIMPTYNCADYIVDAIDSVINQTIEDWEIHIVDDCSTDNTAIILEPYLQKYSNIHYKCLEKNSGPDVARTEAIKNAKGKYVAFLDSDDIWHPEKLEKQISFMEDNKYYFSATGYKRMDADGNDLKVALIPPSKVNYNRLILLANPIGNLTVMYNQDKLGKFAVPMIKKRNDFALWLQILKKVEYCYGLPDILATYRMGRSGSVSSNKLLQAKYHWQLYYNIEKHSFIKSIFEVIAWALVKITGYGIEKRKL